MAGYVVAVDLGGTLTKIGRVYANGSLDSVRRLPTRLDAQQASVSWLADQIAAEAHNDADVCLGYGAVVPGIIDTPSGLVRAAPNVGWFDVPLRAELDQRTGLRGMVDHDVRSAGLAEWELGAGSGASQLIFIALGTGIAAALISDGRLIQADGYAGELGHLPTPAAAGRPCACGRPGCLETVASAAGVVRTYTERTGRKPSGAAEVADLARAGDAAALEAFDLARRALAEALDAAITLLGPELVIIGGGLSGAYDLLAAPLEEDLASRLSFQRMPRLAQASLGADAGLIGAGLVGWKRARGEVDHD